jgi:nucleoid-associated protein YgaU
MFWTKMLAAAGLALAIWILTAHPSGAHGHKLVYRVQAYDTLWTIAARYYDGDVRAGVWRIQQANPLGGTEITPGELLVLP